MQRSILYVAFLAIICTSSCHHKKEKSSSAPPLNVAYAIATADSLIMRYGFVTHLEGKYESVIQPRVNGYLLRQHFRAGMPVKRGDLIFTLDANLLNTTMLAAEANLASAQAQVIEAKNNYDRAVPLARIEAISQSQLDQYTAVYASARSAVESARQSLNNARLQVGYAKIYAPIDGIIAQPQAHEGDYVGPGTKFSQLTTISFTDTLQAEIAIPTSLYLQYSDSRSAFENEGLLSDIRLRLANDAEYEHKGIYDFTRQNISTNSGTITIVVDFPNPDQRLKAGEYARIETGLGQKQRVITIPQQCINRTQGIESVWILKPDSTVEYRRIRTGQTIGSRWIIEDGIKEGEKVIVTGNQKLHNGAKVVAKKFE